MRLVGGGGSPIVSGGSNPAGTGSGLNYAGNLVYAYSGPQNGANSYVTYLRFTTGSELIYGELQFNGAPDPDDPTTGGQSLCRVSMDSQVVAYLKASTNSPDDSANVNSKLVIPPFTSVLIDIRTTANSSFQPTVTFTGAIQ